MNSYLYADLYQLEDRHWWHIAKRQLVTQQIKKYSSSKNLKLLDIGCGTGKNLESFNRLGTAWGIDSSSEALIFCRQRRLKRVKLGRSNKIPFPANSFDVITLLDVLEHVSERPTLTEINRLLKPGGLLIITVPAFPWLWSRWDEVLHHRRRYTQISLSQILDRSNWHLIKISYVYSFLVLPAVIIRWVKTKIFPDYYPSDFRLSNQFVNQLLLTVATIEQKIINQITLPFGTSLIAVVQKSNVS